MRHHHKCEAVLVVCERAGLQPLIECGFPARELTNVMRVRQRLGTRQHCGLAFPGCLALEHLYEAWNWFTRPGDRIDKCLKPRLAHANNRVFHHDFFRRAYCRIAHKVCARTPAHRGRAVYDRDVGFRQPHRQRLFLALRSSFCHVVQIALHERRVNTAGKTGAILTMSGRGFDLRSKKQSRGTERTFRRRN